jgi:type II secretory pathway pseudopilin PulG
MKWPKVRISTLMLLVVIAALVVALVVEKRRSAVMQAQAQARMAEAALAREQAERGNAFLQTNILTDGNPVPKSIGTPSP